MKNFKITKKYIFGKHLKREIECCILELSRTSESKVIDEKQNLTKKQKWMQIK
jgi:hypothetical protein